MLTIYTDSQNSEAVTFCKAFLGATGHPRYVLGRNEYAASIASLVELTGFIDDYTSDEVFLNKPIVRMKDVPRNALVVSAVIFVVPLTAMRNLQSHGLVCLDYFNFLKYSGLAIKEIDFMIDAKQDIEKHCAKYERVYNDLEDDTSKTVLEKLLNFRFSGNLDYMQGFELTPDVQYFENFLAWKPDEVFLDAGGYDGQTALNFIKRCPDYKSIYFFEPDPANIALARQNLSTHRDIHFYNIGLSDVNKTLKFQAFGGSASKLSESGALEIYTDAIDNLITETVSMIKMDIEGSE